MVVVFAVATTVGPTSNIHINDLYVYRTYAHWLLDGVAPYRELPLEYPPLALVPIGLGGVLGTGPGSYEVFFGELMGFTTFAGLFLTAALAGSPESGRRAAWLFAFAPLLTGALARTHFDPVPVAIAVAALLALARGRPVLGCALLGVGTMTKLFPAILLPVALAWLWGRGQRRDVLRGLVAFAAVVAVVSAPFLSRGYLDAYRYHRDRPVQIESTPATVLFALGGSQVTGTTARPDRFKSNGLDGGSAGAVEALFLVVLAAALVAATALAARRTDPRHLVLCAFAALLAFAGLGKVLSPQFVLWLVPFAALAWVWGERLVALLTAAAIGLTQVEFPSRYLDLVNRDGATILLVAARNALLLAALTTLLVRGAAAARSSPRAGAASRSPAPR
jgi:hypothetical protein